MIETVVSYALPIDEKMLIRKNVIKHGTGKKRICIVTGTHGDELEGQYICYKLNRVLNKHLELLDGQVDIYPSLNPLGVDSVKRGIPNFDLDMNRIFPGNPDGSMFEQAAYAICQDLKRADIVIDIHSSNIFLREIPQVRINVNDADRLIPFAKLLNMDFIWIYDAATVLESTLAYSLNSIGTDTLVVEMGVGMRINHQPCDRLVTGILNLLNKMDVWAGSYDENVITSPVLSKEEDVSFINASASGVFITDVKNSIIVDKGENIGYIVNPLNGDILQDVKADIKGLLFTLRAYPIVYEGSLLARIHSMKEK